jgi:hypothetical protein
MVAALLLRAGLSFHDRLFDTSLSPFHLQPEARSRERFARNIKRCHVKVDTLLYLGLVGA